MLFEVNSEEREFSMMLRRTRKETRRSERFLGAGTRIGQLSSGTQRHSACWVTAGSWSYLVSAQLQQESSLWWECRTRRILPCRKDHDSLDSAY